MRVHRLDSIEDSALYESCVQPKEFDGIFIGEAENPLHQLEASSNLSEKATATRMTRKRNKSTLSSSSEDPQKEFVDLLDNVLKGTKIKEEIIPKMDLKTLKFNIQEEEEKYKEELAVKSRLSLRWTSAVVLISYLLYTMARIESNFLIIRGAITLLGIGITLYHFASKFRFRSYSRVVKVTTLGVLLFCTIGQIEYHQFAILGIMLLPFPVCAVSIRTDVQFFKRAIWLYLIALGVVICALDSTLVFIRQVPILFLFGYASCQLCIATERSDRMFYINKRRLEELEAALEEEKSKNIEIINSIYPSQVASDLRQETLNTLKNYISAKVIVIVVRLCWDTDHSSCTIRHTKTAFQLVDTIFGRYKIEMIKQCGNYILGCRGIFDRIDAMQAQEVLQAALDLTKKYERSDRNSRMSLRVGISYGEAACLNIHCMKSAVDIFGSCVDDALYLSAKAEGSTETIIICQNFETILKSCNQERIDRTNSWKESDLSSIVDHDHTGEMRMPSAVKVYPIEGQRRWEFSKKEEPQTVIVDKHNFTAAHNQRSSSPLELNQNSLDVISPQAFDEEEIISLKQIGSVVMIYVIYGLTDIAILSDSDNLSWNRGGHLIFIRMIVIFPIVCLLLMSRCILYHSDSTDPRSRLVKIITFSIYFLCFIYTTWARIVVEDINIPLQSIICFHTSIILEAFLYAEGVFSNCLLGSRSTYIINGADLLAVSIYFLWKAASTRWLMDKILNVAVFYLATWLLMCKLAKIKARIKLTEIESCHSHMKKSLEIKEESEHAEACLLSIMPSSFISKLKQGELGYERYFSNTTVIVLKIANIVELTKLKSPEEVKQLFTEIYEEIEYVCSSAGGEAVKWMGGAYTILFCSQDTEGDRISAEVQKALRFCHQIQHHFSLLVCAHNQKKVIINAGVSTGNCFSGVVKSRRLTFDVWGKAVTEANKATDHCEEGDIFVHRSVFEKLQFSGSCDYKAPNVPKSEYMKYLHVEKVWEQFVSYVDWDIEGTLRHNFDDVI